MPRTNSKTFSNKQSTSIWVNKKINLYCELSDKEYCRQMYYSTVDQLQNLSHGICRSEQPITKNCSVKLPFSQMLCYCYSIFLVSRGSVNRSPDETESNRTGVLFKFSFFLHLVTGLSYVYGHADINGCASVYILLPSTHLIQFGKKFKIFFFSGLDRLGGSQIYYNHLPIDQH